MTTELSKRLRTEYWTRTNAHEAADLIDQQAAEIADLKLRLNRWNSGDNSIGAKEQVKRLMAERDEWQRRAEWLWSRLLIWGSRPEQMYPKAAQWFGEKGD